MKRSFQLGSLIFLVSILCFSDGFAQRKSKSQPAAAGFTDDKQRFDGFIPFYYDAKNDEIFLSISQLDTEILYINSLSAGVGSNDIGLDRAQLGNSRIVRFERRGPKVLLIEPNYDYRAESDNPAEVKAVEDAFATSVLWGFPIASEENGEVIVNATAFLMRDAHNIAGRLKNARQGNYKLDGSRSSMYMERTKGFPKNSEFETLLTFTGTPTGGYIRSVTPTPEAVSVRLHHSFVELPEDGYTPRVFDPRAGYFPISYFDYATPIEENINKQFIRRHRLEKKDPSAPTSEAVEPIVYYLDPGTPEPVRSALLDGARWWDQAFEAAGYINAFQVEMLPEDADPMDVRYNVINWVHRSTRGWSYGSSVTDPRTGEIIKGHVTLGSLRVRQDFLIAEGLLAPYDNGESVPPEMLQMALARLRQLSAHEVGHTLGLSHNYSSSMDGRASVMDYPHPLVELSDNGEISLSNAYDDKIGAWDKVAITYGYQDFPDGADEHAGLKKILADAYAGGLTFISDQDARPQGGAHPRAHLWDNGENAATELNRVMQIRGAALTQFGEKNIRGGEPYATLEEVLVPIYFFHRYQVEAAVKTVGGLDYTYALRGDGQVPTTMIPPEAQQQALEAVLGTITPQALMLPEDLLTKIPPRALGSRRGREVIQLRTGLTFDALGASETAATMTTSLLLNPARASRLVEYRARDNSQPGLANTLDQVIDATWKSSRSSDYAGEVARVVDMAVLKSLFKLAANSEASDQARAITHMKILDLDKWIVARTGRETQEIQKAHLMYAHDMIGRYQQDPTKFQGFDTLRTPAGSPIGTDYAACGHGQLE